MSFTFCFRFMLQYVSSTALHFTFIAFSIPPRFLFDFLCPPWPSCDYPGKTSLQFANPWIYGSLRANWPYYTISVLSFVRFCTFLMSLGEAVTWALARIHDKVSTAHRPTSDPYVFTTRSRFLLKCIYLNSQTFFSPSDISFLSVQHAHVEHCQISAVFGKP